MRRKRMVVSTSWIDDSFRVFFHLEQQIEHEFLLHASWNWKLLFLMQNKWAINVHIFSRISSCLVAIATCNIFNQFAIEGAAVFVGKKSTFFHHLFWHYAEDTQSIQNTLSHTLFFFLFGVVVIFSHLFIRIGASDERQRRHQRTIHSTNFRINL